MPSKNSIKIYSDNSIYHIYNRGVNKSDIFLDQQDFSVFCSYLKDYLLPKDSLSLNLILSSKTTPSAEKNKALKLIQLKNFSDKISLLCYALLPNHYHLLLHQTDQDSIEKFTNAFGTRYSLYFNRKHHRIGPLFQGRYKAVSIDSDEQLLHLSRYIHLNPFLRTNLPLSDWRKIPWPFSLPEYLGTRNTKWVKSDLILNYFHKNNPNNNYQHFMGETLEMETITPLLTDSDPD